MANNTETILADIGLGKALTAEYGQILEAVDSEDIFVRPNFGNNVCKKFQAILHNVLQMWWLITGLGRIVLLVGGVQWNRNPIPCSVR
jgi:hypothetical protein